MGKRNVGFSVSHFTYKGRECAVIHDGSECFDETSGKFWRVWRVEVPLGDHAFIVNASTERKARQKARGVIDFWEENGDAILTWIEP